MLRLLMYHLMHYLMAHEFAALFALLLIEEAGVPLPVPGDSLLVVAGAVHRHTPGYAAEVIVTSSAAVFLGSSLLYGLMRQGGRPLLERYGRYLHISPARLQRVESWFRRHGPLAIILGRLIPGLRIPTTVMAGLSNVPYRVYAPTAALAAVIWSSIYFWLGVLLYRHLALIASLGAGLIDRVSDWAVAFFLLLLLAAVGIAWYMRMRVRRGRMSTKVTRADDRTPSR